MDVPERKILWFTDTLGDMNGVSYTLAGFAQQAQEHNMSLKVVSTRQVVENSLILPVLFRYTPWFYKTYTLDIPAWRASWQLIEAERPTEILISTPGPIGLLGLWAARKLKIPSRGIYHSDFRRMAQLGLGCGPWVWLVERYVCWFYGRMNQILVPTQVLIDELISRGYAADRMKVFSRGIDTELFAPVFGARDALHQRYAMDGSFTLFYAGRISRDKSLDLLIDVYRELSVRGVCVNLLIAGEGPMMSELKALCAPFPGIRLLGRVERQDLPLLYSGSDLFVFPSTMDTFGMAVLEAQACGLPALVTNIGGPQEIVAPDATGYVLQSKDIKSWVDKILQLRDIQRDHAVRFKMLQRASRERVQKFFTWGKALKELFSL